MDERDAAPGIADPAATLAKEEQLRAWLAAQPAVLVAFSAGVDSTYLLAVAHQVLGERCTAVTADSPSLARRSLAEAEAFCQARGIAHRIVATDEFDQAAYRANDGSRCYECKAALLRAMQALAAIGAGTTEQTPTAGATGCILIGALAEDFDDYRPGLAAAREAGARWPLADCALHKPEVRWLSHRLGLASWNRPAEPCLASRLPYGEAVDRAVLTMVERAEAVLHEAGFPECRARHHRVGDDRGHLCRIEVPAAAIERLVAARAALLPQLQNIGYAQICCDLAGLQSGGFNQFLHAMERQRHA